MATARFHTAVATTALGAATALAGCAGASIPIPDACELLTASQVSTIVGFEVREGEIYTPATGPAQSVCEFDGDGGSLGTVSIVIANQVRDADNRRAASDPDIYGDSVDIEIEGTRDAYALLDGALVGMNYDPYYVEVYVGSPSADVADEEAVTLAEAVIGAI